MIPAIPLPTLPAMTYRRTYFAAHLARRARQILFGDLLNRLAPDVYTRLRDRSPMSCYRTLVTQVGKLFPVYEPEFENWGGEPQWDEVGEAVDFGIPVNVYGLDEEWLLHSGPDKTSPALALILVLGEDGYDWENLDILKRYIKRLNPLMRQRTQPDYAVWRALIKADNFFPPRGRAWRNPWGELRELCEYCHHNTGYAVLDYSSLMVDEGGGNPPWNLEEIRGLAQDWKNAQPVWKRIETLRAYIDADPDQRLILLLKLLLGNNETRQALSQPKHPKTLAQVFADEK